MHTVMTTAIAKKLNIQRTIFYDLALVILGSLSIGLSAQFSYRLPFSPVPVTAQTFAVLLIGVLLGTKKAGASLVLYLSEGLSGLPVFAGGKSGIATLLGPTGGYLIGFLVAAMVIGYFAEKGFDKRWHTTIFAFLAGQAVIYLCGWLHLAVYLGFKQAFNLGVAPFLIWDAIKTGMAMIVLPGAWNLLGKRSG